MEKLDDIDLKILRILQKDSKKTTKEVAEMLNLSASPVYERTRRLEKKGYIKKYVALLDKKLINKPITAICMVSLRYHNEGFIEKFERQIKELKEVQECYHMAGKVDFFLKINLIKNQKDNFSFNGKQYNFSHKKRSSIVFEDLFLIVYFF